MIHAINNEMALENYPKSLLETMQHFRKIMFTIGQSPEKIVDFLDFPGIARLATDRDSTALERVQLIEALAYGDSGVLLACPGPSLAGLMLRELGSPEQQHSFFDYVERHRCTTFLAVTEPNKGSDAGQMQTRLEKADDESFHIYGEKWLVGHGADAPLGVVVARTSPGPLGICAVLLSPEILQNAGDTLYREHLNTLGLKGARLSRLVFNGVKIYKKDIIGYHLSPMQRGMMALIKTFNQMRPGVASFAIGQAQATLDYAKTHMPLSYSQKHQIALLNSELKSARVLLHEAAKRVDNNKHDSAFSSLSKVKATGIVEKITEYVSMLFGVRIFDHPLLIKYQMDAYGYEYMEGTSHIQLKQVYQGFMNKAFDLKNNTFDKANTIQSSGIQATVAMV